MRYSLGDNVATNPTPIGRVEVNYSDNKQVGRNINATFQRKK